MHQRGEPTTNQRGNGYGNGNGSSRVGREGWGGSSFGEGETIDGANSRHRQYELTVPSHHFSGESYWPTETNYGQRDRPTVVVSNVVQHLSVGREGLSLA